MTQYGWDNCPYDTRHQVAVIRDGIIQLLGDNLIGIYLHGSLAFGCFNPQRSDIDLLAVTREVMRLKIKRQLATLLLDNSAPYLPPSVTRPVEISVLTWDQLHPWQYPTPYDFHYSEGWRAIIDQQFSSERRFDRDIAAHVVVTRYVGLPLQGAPVDEVFPTIPEQDYSDALLYDLEGLDAKIESSPNYYILNACRVLAFLQDREIFSKEAAALWALQELPPELHEIVEQALGCYRGEHDDQEYDLALLHEFAWFMAQQVEGLRR